MQAIARRAAAPIFALALFSSAALIFVLQPLVGRMVTPLLGGSPSVWNTAMAFFQAALLAGYLYAHLLARLKDLRLQAAIHGVVLLAAWLVLPLHVSQVLGPPSSEHPALWLVGVLTLSVGAPFAAAAATAPLLQAWYARTGRTDAHDPYYLYAASNLGSFIGLLAYPALIEPLLGAQAQSLAWSAGYMLVGALIALAAAMAIAAKGEAPAHAEKTEAPSWRTRLYWMAAAAIPSALSLGVTQHISTDVASAPMLWVIPLALYLLTFVLAFMRGGERLTSATSFIHPIALALLLSSYYASGNWIGSVGGILGGFFFSALLCHLALARTRPSADKLTEFFLFVSLGGVLGGVFAALLAPVIFNNVYEYPLALAAACLFRPRAASDMPRLTDASLAAAAAMGVTALMLMWTAPLDAILATAALGAAAAIIAAAWSEAPRPAPLRYGFLAIAALHAVLVLWAVCDVAFKFDAVFVHNVEAGSAQLITSQPWAALFLVSSFLLLCFAVHATIQRRRNGGRVSDIALGAAMPSLILLIMLVIAGAKVDARALIIMAVMFCGLGIFFNRGRPIALASLVLMAFAIIFLDDVRGGRVITQERSFFGVLRTRVVQHNAEDPPLRILMHGTTIHGAQLASPGLTRQPLTYYHARTALGESILAGLALGESSHLALIGLGAGSTACLTRSADTLTIFEIDPAMVRLSARPGGDFTYVPECQPDARIELGDARLQIAEEPNGAFDVIVVDAFSSDAIPAHLLTREAIALYLAKLSERGVIVLHLSNRNLALVSEAARVARDLEAPTLFRISDRFEQPYVSYYGGLAASVMIVARSPDVLARLPLPSNDWVVFEAPPGRAWSDDYINLPRALWDSVIGAEQCRIYPYLPDCEIEPAPAN